MCDEQSVDDMTQLDKRTGEWTRRQIAHSGLGAAAAMLTPGMAVAKAAARQLTESEIVIKTPDGACDAYFVHPARGRHAGVLIWTDILGLRPAFRQMASRLAGSGYAVLVPNPFYRTRPAPTAAVGANLQDEKTRKDLFALAGTLNSQTLLTDAKACIGFLDADKAVDGKRKIATTGYCMGGPMVLRTAGAFSARIGAAASFHGGGLVTDKADSPHHSISQMRAASLIAIADNDDQRSPEDKNVLRKSFDAAHLSAEIEVYAGAMHGWCPPDAMAYNKDAAEKAWGRMLALFDKALA
jgi:carboxymethylenebutenolidase